ncbi:MAG TPA: response regulator, partial [Humisphaera sp.]
GDPAAAARPLRILLVEDHADTARVMGRVLRTFGHDVATADSVGAALETADAAADGFDVVISDVGLPDGTGHDLMRQLLARFAGVRGIALTGYGTDDDVRRSGDAGFVAHLTKPVDVRELEETIHRVARGGG